MYKLIVSDIDGTLINSKHMVSDKTLKYIEKAQKKGVFVGIATGRIYSSAKFYAQKINANIPTIACNGAIIRNHKNDEILYENFLSDKSLLKISEILQKENIYFHAYDANYLYCPDYKKTLNHFIIWNKESLKEDINLENWDEDKVFEKFRVRIKEIKNIKNSLEKNIHFLKILVIDEDYDKILRVRNLISDIEDIEITSSNFNNIEIMNKGISKGEALKKLCELFKVNKEEVIAFGDNCNDKTMIEIAGMGVAVSNANEDLKKSAKYITLSNEESGVGEGIKTLLNL